MRNESVIRWTSMWRTQGLLSNFSPGKWELSLTKLGRSRRVPASIIEQHALEKLTGVKRERHGIGSRG